MPPVASCSERPLTAEIEPPVASLARPPLREILPVLLLALLAAISIVPELDCNVSPVWRVVEPEPMIPRPLSTAIPPLFSIAYAESKLITPDVDVVDPDFPAKAPPAIEPLPAITLVLPPTAPLPAAIRIAPADDGESDEIEPALTTIFPEFSPNFK